jgi:diguanylate cyclase (GGDEF)-like protein
MAIGFAHYNAVLDSLDEQIAVIDREGTIVLVNREWRNFCAANDGEPGASGPGSNYLAICRRGGDDGRQAVTGIDAVIRGELPCFTLEYPCHSEREQRWFVLRCMPLGDAMHDYFVLAHRNVTAYRASGAAPAAQDALLVERGGEVALNAHVEQEWARSRRNALRLSLLVLQIDNFDARVERFGREAADDGMRQVARVLSRYACRPGDKVARLGEDRFAVLMTQTDIVDAYYRGLDMRRAIGSVELATLHGQPLTASVGVGSLIPAAARSPGQLLENASRALERARALGGDRVELFQQEINALRLRARPRGRG